MPDEKRGKPPRYKMKFLIDAKSQLHIISRLGILVLFFTLFICFFAYRWLMNLRPLFDQTLAGPAKPEEAFQIIANLLMYRLLGILVLMLVLFFVAGVVLSHRLTGPIWKLERDIQRFLAGGDIEPLQFRKTDAFQNLPGLIRRLVSGYTGPRG